MKNRTTFSSLLRYLVSGGIIWNLATIATIASVDGDRDAAPVPSLVRDAMPRDFTPGYLAERLGVAQRASILFGVPVEDRGGHAVGKLDDIVVDLSSGKIFCALVASTNGGNTVAVPAKTFYSADDKEALLDLKTVNLLTAPPAGGVDARSIVNSLQASYNYFNQKATWDVASAPANARKCGELIGQRVFNKSGESLGRVVNVVVDLPTARVLFVVLSYFGTGSDLYAVPPMAIQVTANSPTLLLNADKAKVASLAHSDGFFWSNMADPNWDLAAYRNFGQQADFDTSIVNSAKDPTRENVRTKVETTTPVKNDRQIQQDILTAMMHDDVNNAVIYNRVLISVSNGHVTLIGRVKSEKQRAKLVAIATGIAGAENLNDDLQIR